MGEEDEEDSRRVKLVLDEKEKRWDRSDCGHGVNEIQLRPSSDRK